MTLSARRLNRATLARQFLLRRERLPVVEVVRQAVALQAQEPASPYVALWNRVAGFDPAHLDAAYAAFDVVKATSLRATLHAVHADDYPVVHGAMAPTLRAARLRDHRFVATGLTADDAEALLVHVVEFARTPRTNADISAMIAARLDGLPKPHVWWALRTFAPLVHAPTGGPWSFGIRPAYLTPPAPAAPDGRDELVQQLALRYLEGFGPASVADLAQFTRLPRSTVRAALQAQGDRLERLEGPTGFELFDVHGAPLPAEDTPAPPRLMAMWDSALLAYADRSRVIPPDYRPLVIRPNGDVLPTLLVDGFVAGVWRPVDAGIEATAFHSLPEKAWGGLAEEARSLLSLLADRDPAAYRRYGRWWSRLPIGEVRLLPG